MQGDAQRQALKRLLADPETKEFVGSIFYHEARLRAPLRSLVSDPEIGLEAARLLALIGVDEDLRFLIEHPPTAPGYFSNRWAYDVAASLADPSNDEEWTFLRKCAFNEFDDRWTDAGGVQTLKLIATPRSRKILEEARTGNAYRASLIDRALAYVQSGPPPFTSADLRELGARVAQAVKIGEWPGNGPPRFDESGNRALIDFHFETAEDSYVYTATFFKTKGTWKFCGVRETLQQFRVKAPAK